jgi:hypothetical protein
MRYAEYFFCNLCGFQDKLTEGFFMLHAFVNREPLD